MAGIIVFRAGDWYSSGGGFVSMAEGVISQLACNSRSEVAVRDALRLAIDSGLYFLEIPDDFDREMLKDFGDALDKYCEDCRQRGQSGSFNPDVYDGHMSRMSELQTMIRAELANPVV